MGAFPTPTRSPALAGYTEPLPSDAVSRGSYASGYPVIDDDFTFTADIWAYHLRMVVDADKVQIKAHWKQFKATEFLWYHTTAAVYRTVIYEGEPTFTLDTKLGFWRIDLAFRQVNSSEQPTLFDGGPTVFETEDLAAGADITARPIFGSQYGRTFSKITMVTKGQPVGISDASIARVSLANGAGSTIVSKTFDTANQPPTNGAIDLGPLLITSIAANDIITLTVAQGSNANLPPFALVME
jgi:hypothetical protein